jgi:hypothetical protein
MARTTKKALKLNIGKALAVSELRALTAELQFVRTYRPLTRHRDGRYEGDILGFVKGLRLSARLTYFLRKRLSSTTLEVNWGHLLDENQDSCSPECDIVIHAKGHVEEWNGGREHQIMSFKFIRAEDARAVVSCKSQLNSIDTSYPKALSKFGVADVFLFAESCKKNRYAALNKAAKKAGYRGLWCLYLTEVNGTFVTDDRQYIEFGNAIAKAVGGKTQ